MLPLIDNLLILQFILKMRFPTKVLACGISILLSFQQILSSINNFTKYSYVVSDLSKKFKLPLPFLVFIFQVNFMSYRSAITADYS